MRRTTSRTSTAPMELRRRRATQADVGLAGLAEGAGRAEAAIAGPADDAGAAEGGPAAGVDRRAAETASD